jgi:hypothetical protein
VTARKAKKVTAGKVRFIGSPDLKALFHTATLC